MTDEKKTRYSSEEINDIRKNLLSMPEKEKDKTKKEVIEELRKEIEILITRGYSLDDVCDALKSQNLIISTPTLRKYLNEKDKKRKPVQRKKSGLNKEAVAESEERKSSTFNIKDEDDI